MATTATAPELDNEGEPTGEPAVVTTQAPAPAPPTAAPAGPRSFDDLIVTPEKAQALNDRMLALKRQQAGQSAGVVDESISRLRANRADVDAAFKAATPNPDDFEPWDAAAKRNEFRTDPVDAFGSAGSVFAMLVASFAGLPMEHALNAGAAAINAVHAGDEKAYNREFESWKANTDLALKRQNVMHQHYNDAILRMNTNLNAGRSELEMAARKYGDQTAIAMLEAGLDKELNDLVTGRNKSALELQKTANEVWLQHEKTQDLKNDPRWLSGNPALKAAAVQEWQERWRPGGRSQLAYDATRDYVESQKKANPDWTPTDLLRWQEEATEANTRGKPIGQAVLQAQEIQRRTEQYVGEGMSKTEAFDRANREVTRTAQRQLPFDSEADFVRAKEREIKEREGRELTGDERAALKRQWTEAENAKTANAGVRTRGRAEQEEIDRRRNDYVAQGMNPTEAWDKASREVAGKSPSGNEINRMRGKIDQIEHIVEGAEKTLDFLRTYKGGAGLMGSIMRGVEVSTNVVGLSTQSDRVQFRRRIREMQDMAPQIFTDSSGRPLAAQIKKVDDVIAGLNAGDTGPNTIRAYEELINDMRKFARNYDRRIREPYKGEGVGGPDPEGTRKHTPKSTPSWQQAPKIGPRSSIEQPGMVISDADPEPIQAGAKYAMMPPSAVSKPQFVDMRPTPQERLESSTGELDDLVERLSPRMYDRLLAYARKLNVRTSGGPR